MRDKTWYDKNRWRLKKGYHETDLDNHILEQLEESEWSPRFERLRKNRLIIGAFRYGLLNDRRKKKWNRIQVLIEKLELYKETGNTECLVDIANYAMLEFEEGNHPKKHFKSTHDVNHAKVKNERLDPASYTTGVEKIPEYANYFNKRPLKDYTCFNCEKAEKCMYAYNEYNTDGDCLALIQK
jgi:hypothetical protein